MLSLTHYKIGWMIALITVFGFRIPLLLSFVGDILFVLHPDSYYHPVLAFTLSHLVYGALLGFPSQCVAMILVAFNVTLMSPKMALPLYTMVLGMNIFLAVDRHGLTSNAGIGYVLFGISDILIYIRDFMSKKFYGDHIISLSLYFISHFFILSNI